MFRLKEKLTEVGRGDTLDRQKWRQKQTDLGRETDD